MSAKPTGLAAFTQKGSVLAPEGASGKKTRTRAQGETVALTLRVKKSDWMRLRQLADSEGMNLTGLMRAGLSEQFTKRGLPGLED